MATEIERKFLVEGEGWRAGVTRADAIRQNYLVREGGLTVRLRTRGDQAWLTVKAGTDTLSRQEFEYPIPHADAEAMLALCTGPEVAKTRHIVPASHGLVWEVDVFASHPTGLVLAEIELPSADAAFDRPDWLGAEVTHDPAYLNVNLHKLGG